jgi:hypothetical protein
MQIKINISATVRHSTVQDTDYHVANVLTF